MPFHSAGLSLLQSFTREGFNRFNLRIATLLDLAMEVCGQSLYEDKIEKCTDNDYILYEILRTLSQQNKLEYFKGLQITPSLSGAVFGAISELKHAGIAPQDLVAAKYADPKKGKDFKQIYARYEEVLKQTKRLDACDLLTMAINQSADFFKNQVFIIPSNLKLSRKETEFIGTILNHAEILHIPAPLGLEKPVSRITVQPVSRITEEPASPLAWLYHVEGFPGDKEIDLEIISGYGENNEVREVIRHIGLQNLRFDEAAVFYTYKEAYSQLFYDISRQYDIPITFGDGINISNSAPGRLLAGLLKFLDSNFNVAELIPLLTSESLIPDTKVSGTEVISYLRLAGIGWGRDRYPLQLRKLSSDASMLQETLDFINGLLGCFPGCSSDNSISLDQLALGLAEAVNRYSCIATEADTEAREKIVQKLHTIAGSLDSQLSCDQAVKVLEDTLQNIRIQRSRPLPGHLHVDSFSKGVWINRKSTYIVGLNSDRFPGSAREDAILLDTERAAISPDLKLGRNRGKEKTYVMAELLASLPGSVVLSYPCFNTVENKELFPSSILLQAYRLYSGDPRKDYSALCSFIKSSDGYVPQCDQKLLDENEWWIRPQLAKFRSNLSPVLESYPGLSKGVAAWDQRQEPSFSPFDGRVPVDKNFLDPRINHDRVVSPSQLEMLAKCPFSYFLRHILRVKPLEELVYEPGMWLDAAQRGTLLHKIFETYFSSIVKRDERPNFEGHSKFLFELADEIIGQARLVVPPPNAAVYEYEKRELLESCMVFLHSEEEHAGEGVPIYFEFGFGISGRGFQEEPVLIEYKPGTGFKMRGSIDRVDKISTNSFRVVDYKTGSTYSYKVKEPFKGGRQLQYALYAVALETILKESKTCPDAAVEEGGYIFPTTRGEGQRIIRKPIDRQSLTAILDGLFELMASGCFNMSDSAGDCTFCDYAPICSRGFFEEALIDKLKAPDLAHFWEVRKFA